MTLTHFPNAKSPYDPVVTVAEDAIVHASQRRVIVVSSCHQSKHSMGRRSDSLLWVGFVVDNQEALS